LEAHTIIT